MSYKSAFRPGMFENHAIIVTGGGSGIGRCAAHELASLGARVALVGRNSGKLERVADEIRADGGSASIHVCDVRDEVGVTGTVDAVLRAHGRIDGLVNNAGGQFHSPMKDISTKGFEAVVRNNLVGGFIFMREVYTRWMKEHGGAIVNMSAALYNGLPGFAHSGAARSGMINLSETAACEWAVSGVRVNCVAPGLIASSGFDSYEEKAAQRLLDYARTIPSQRYGNVAEVSAAIVFLLSSAASFITGATIRIDGGGSRPPGMWALEPHDKSVPFDGFHRDSTPDLLRRAHETR